MAASIDSLEEELTTDVDLDLPPSFSIDEECEEEDDELQGWISCESSNNDYTKSQRKYALSLFRDFSKQVNVNFEDIDNKALDVLLSNFYKAARNKKGDLLSTKSMRFIRFGLQRYFLESHGIDIIRSDEFSLSHKTFKAMIRKLIVHGKDKVRHHPQITVDDMARMQASLDLSTPQGLQHKVFLDTVLYFGKSGMKNLHTTRPGDFVLHQEHNQIFYTFRENQKAQMHAMPGNPRCPVANLRRYISKLSFNCEWMWQRPKQHFLEDPCNWYEDSPLGKRTLSFMTRTISELAGCNKEHTIHSLMTSMTEKMLETLSRNDTSQNRDEAITVITLPSSTSNSVVAQINKTITASPRVPVATTTGSSMNIIKLPSVTASSSDKATHLLTMQQDNSVTSESKMGVNEGTMTDLTWIELPRKLVQCKDASTQWEKQASLKQLPTHSAIASTSSTQGLDKPSCSDDGELEQDGLRWCSEDTPAVQEDESMDSSDSSDVHIDGSNIVAGSRGDVQEKTVAGSQEGEQSNTPILRRIKEEMIDESEEVVYQTFYVKQEYLEDHCEDDDHLIPGGHPRLEAESPRSSQQINSDGAPRQNVGSCNGSKEAMMDEATLPRFELLDDQLQDSINSANSKNTEKTVKSSTADDFNRMLLYGIPPDVFKQYIESSGKEIALYKAALASSSQRMGDKEKSAEEEEEEEEIEETPIVSAEEEEEEGQEEEEKGEEVEERAEEEEEEKEEMMLKISRKVEKNRTIDQDEQKFKMKDNPKGKRNRIPRPCPICNYKTSDMSKHLERKHRLNGEERWKYIYQARSSVPIQRLDRRGKRRTRADCPKCPAKNLSNLWDHNKRMHSGET